MSGVWGVWVDCLLVGLCEPPSLGDLPLSVRACVPVSLSFSLSSVTVPIAVSVPVSVSACACLLYLLYLLHLLHLLHLLYLLCVWERRGAFCGLWAVGLRAQERARRPGGLMA